MPGHRADAAGRLPGLVRAAALAVASSIASAGCTPSEPVGAEPAPAAGSAEPNPLLTDGAEVAVTSRSPAPRTITRTPLRLAGGSVYELVEIASPEQADLTDTVALAPDGGVWFSAEWSDRVVGLDPDTLAVTEYQLPRGCGPRALTVDRHGVHWVICLMTDALLEVHPGPGRGVVHRPPVSGFMTWVVADPVRDRVWVCKPTENLVLGFTRGEGFEVFRIPTTDGGPGQPGLDRRGRLWFPLLYGNRLVRFDPADGSFAQFPLPTEAALPVVTMVHARGDVWTSEHRKDRLAVFREPDAFDEIELPTAGSGVNSLDDAPDGAVWFAEGGWRGSLGSNRIGRYQPRTEEIEEIELPNPHSQPVGLRVDSAGRVWFVEMGTGRIGLIRPAAALR